MKNHEDTALTPQQVLSQLQGLLAEAKTLVADSASNHATSTLDNLYARFAAAQERCATLYDGTKKKVIAGAKYTDESIREYPYQALAIAAGVGLLVGVLMSRRGK